MKALRSWNTPRCLSLPLPPPQRSPLFPYTTLFRSHQRTSAAAQVKPPPIASSNTRSPRLIRPSLIATSSASGIERSEEHTSELQSRPHLVCRLLLEKKKI